MARAADSKRVIDLRRVFTINRMSRAWSNAVRQGLRRQALQDLHDYLDIHRNLKTLLPRIRADILESSFRPREPEVVVTEKKLGITRRLIIPSPIDAIVLQTIVDAIEGSIKKRRPSSRAFYSRSHQGPTVESMNDTFGYPWWDLWPKFQQEIWGFGGAKQFTVTTDIANYFDTIPLKQLRNAIASQDSFAEAVLDFLFLLLESFIWRPDYIPLSGVGLPQINFDAPRLLSYAYLFPADRLLDEKTSGHFVRWMDDIDFGVDSEQAGRLTGC